MFDDFSAIADVLGLRLKTRPVRLFGGGMQEVPRILFSGFASQGDGACFEAHYSYAADTASRIRQHAPHDIELHAIADTLQAVQRRNSYELVAETTQHGRYYDEYAMWIVVDRNNAVGQAPSHGAENVVVEALRDLARWLYRQLEREYDHLLSDAVADEMISANSYTFTEVGERFG